MANEPVTKRDQYALITYLVNKLSGGRAPGKKALQKLVHLVEELGGVDAGYRFSFYTYGPYSSDLTGDLDAVAGQNGINVVYLKDENSYQITTGENSSWVLDRGQSFVERNASSVDRVIAQFGGRLAKDLELVSTVVYLRRHAPELFDDESKVLERVHALKPRYSNSEIRDAIKEIKSFASA